MQITFTIDFAPSNQTGSIKFVANYKGKKIVAFAVMDDTLKQLKYCRQSINAVENFTFVIVQSRILFHSRTLEAVFLLMAPPLVNIPILVLVRVNRSRFYNKNSQMSCMTLSVVL